MVTHVVGVSKYVLDRHLEERFFSGAERSVIHNSRPPLGNQASTPAKPHSPFRVGFIGRVDATKGISEFFASVAAANIPNIEVHIAGRDNEGVVSKLTRRHPQLTVLHHGFANACEFYELVDLVVVSSMWNEPFGTVSFEPWEFYKPSIAFAVGGLPEVYQAFPELTVPRGDVAALGGLIRRFVVDAAFYARIAQQCRARRDDFLPSIQVKKFEDVLLSLERRRNTL